ncbi:MAG: MBL fold metallo-hydrolase [Reichenbachiella sp.]
MVKKIIKMLLYSILGLIGLLIVTIVLFVNFYPSFGGEVKGARLERAQESPNHNGEIFQNEIPVMQDNSIGQYRKILAKMLKGNANGTPSKKLPSIQWKEEQVDALLDTVTTAVWYGHSSFYLKMNGKNILLDPMFGNYPSPAPGLIGKRFDYDMPIEISDLPEIDVVVFSHDHYDHLDYESVLKLKDKTKHFITPLGVGAHLESWGVKPEKITELYWNESLKIDSIEYRCTPAQHFSGRGTTDRFRTLWSSWAIKGQHNIYFSGDSGYFDGFKEIGERYGPFDISFMECGQYDELWGDIHMFPEQTAQAALDVQSKQMMPIHWGGFKLGNHDWDDPIKRVKKASDSLGVKLLTPQIGEAIVLGEVPEQYGEWWKLK